MRRRCTSCASSRRSIRATATDAFAFSCADKVTQWAPIARIACGASGLQVRGRRPRRRVATSRPRPLPANGPNQVWAYDFVFDACANGQQLKCLTVIDEWTRECLAIDVAGSIRSGRVIEVLSRLVSVRGAPRYLRSDNGPEFVSSAILRWVTAENIETAHIDPGKPWQNGTDESFNGKLRDECLSMEWFRTGPKRRRDRELAAALQRGPSALEPRLFDTGGVSTEAAAGGIKRKCREGLSSRGGGFLSVRPSLSWRARGRGLRRPRSGSE